MDDLAQAEAEKYRRVWAFDQYRVHSPGEKEAPAAFIYAGMRAGNSLTDFGAGTGRASAWFAEKGLRVLAVDHVREALEVEVQFAQACLWDMGAAGIPAADFGFCCDVMEHIPRECVFEVLEGIAARVNVGCWFSIATRPDVMGRLIGEPLHLTIEPATFWRDALARSFGDVDVFRQSPRDVVIWATR